MGFPLRLPRKMTTMSENGHGTTLFGEKEGVVVNVTCFSRG